jgi:hypothetical protein
VDEEYVMSIGSILIGTAALIVVAAYVARPFRARGTSTTDEAIEAWVARIGDEPDEKDETYTDRPSERAAPREEAAERVVNFCPQCGQRAEPEDRFCSGCGTPLRRAA